MVAAAPTSPLNSRGSRIIGYACDGFELWTLILCVQIGCIRHWKCHSSITVVIRGSCVQGPFKAYRRAFATTLLNGPQKSKESKKETTYKELRRGERNTLSKTKAFVAGVSHRFAVFFTFSTFWQSGHYLLTQIEPLRKQFQIVLLEAAAPGSCLRAQRGSYGEADFIGD